jgi:hypothetical protein
MTEPCEHCHFHEPEGDHLFLKIVTSVTNTTWMGLIYATQIA